MKTALVTGVNGQVCSYLVEHLLSLDYKVIGVRRRASIEDNSNLENVLSHPNFSLLYGDLTDYCSIFNLINTHRPDEIYNLAAQSFVTVSFDQPLYTWQVNAEGVINILESVRSLMSGGYSPKILSVNTSEQFGYKYDVDDNGVKYQNENTEMEPQSPYGISKLMAYQSARLYRRAYNMFCSCIIMFNAESPRRGKQFVTRKITSYIGDLLSAKNKENFPKLKLGNINSYRDWGHAREYAQQMHKILQHDMADDFVICTEQTQTIKTFLEEAFSYVGLNWEDFVEIDPALFRPAEVDYLRGDCSKAKNILGWEPKTTFRDLVKEMVDSDVAKARL